MSSGLGLSRCFRRRWGRSRVRSVITVRWWRGSSTGTGRGSRGGICRGSSSGRGRRGGSGTAGSLATGPGIGSSACCWRRATRPGTWTGPSRWTPRSTGPTSTPRIRDGPTTPRGARSNHKNPTGRPSEPAGHGIGRSRGGLSTKIHHAVDGRGRPLAVIVAPGQGHDGSMLPDLLAEIRVARTGAGRPRTKPAKVLGDKAYSSRAIRTLLRKRGIVSVIPEPRDQRANRARRGSRGGRPVTYDHVTYKGRNVVERSFARLKQWRGLATRYDKLAIVYRAAALLAAVITWLQD